MTQPHDALRPAARTCPRPPQPRAWLLRPAGPAAVAFLAAVLLARAARVAVVSAQGGMDNAFLVHAGQVWLHGGAPYADRRFLCLPSAVLFAGDQALLPRLGVPPLSAQVVALAAASAGLVCAGRRWRRPVRRGSRTRPRCSCRRSSWCAGRPTSTIWSSWFRCSSPGRRRPAR